MKPLAEKELGITEMEVLHLGNTQLDCGTLELSTPTGTIRLNNKEFQVLSCLMRQPRRLFPTGELMERIWGWDARAEINVVWTNISYLRRKLERLNSNLRIRSLRNAGYRLEVQ